MKLTKTVIALITVQSHMSAKKKQKKPNTGRHKDRELKNVSWPKEFVEEIEKEARSKDIWWAWALFEKVARISPAMRKFLAENTTRKHAKKQPFATKKSNNHDDS
jgi:hypothetical protein